MMKFVNIYQILFYLMILYAFDCCFHFYLYYLSYCNAMNVALAQVCWRNI